MREPLFSYCACGEPGCQQLVQGEFAPGHDAKRKAMLWTQGSRRGRGPGRTAANAAGSAPRRCDERRPTSEPRTADDRTLRVRDASDPRRPGPRRSLRRRQRARSTRPRPTCSLRWANRRCGTTREAATRPARPSRSPSPPSKGGKRGFAFGSGMGAETTLLLTLQPGDHVVLGDDVYGGTYRLLSKVLSGWGLTMSTVDLGDLDALAAAMTSWTKLVWIETPSNPLLKIVDIGAVVGDRPRGGGARRGRQHVRDPRSAAAAGARGRRRGAQRHEVPRWSFRPDRWRRRHQR